MPEMAGKEVIMITETARAKINLTLWVGRKRPDGYHSIDSVMHSISLSDEITLEKSNEILLTVLEGDAPAGQENLMVRAAEAFFSVTELEGGVFLTLKKRIPSGAGMGGALPMQPPSCADFPKLTSIRSAKKISLKSQPGSAPTFPSA